MICCINAHFSLATFVTVTQNLYTLKKVGRLLTFLTFFYIIRWLYSL